MTDSIRSKILEEIAIYGTGNIICLTWLYSSSALRSDLRLRTECIISLQFHALSFD